MLRLIGRGSLFSKTYGKSLPLTQARALSTVVQEETKVSVASNGLKVATESNSDCQTATIGVFVNTGSSYETRANNGVAHFLEHLAFKGTEKRTQTQLEVEVENMGGSLNAYTSREHTVYLARVFKKDLPKAVDILSDIIQNSKYTAESIEVERSVILREMEEVNGNVQEAIFDHLHSIAFQGSSMGLTILGPKDNILKFQREDFAEYIRTHYTSDRMVVVGTGCVDHAELESLVQDHFNKLQPTSPVDFSQFNKPNYTGSSLTIYDDRMHDTNVAVAFEGASWSSPDHLPLLIIQSIVGNYDRCMGGGKNLSSRLSEVISYEQLAHKVQSYNTCYNTTGLFGAHMVTTPDKLEDLICEVLNEYVRIAHGVTEAEVDRAKNRLKAVMLMQMDGPTPICEEVGRQLLTLGRRVTPAELVARIEAIDVASVRDVATRYLTDQEPSVVAIGDCSTFPDYNAIRGWTHWWRA